MSTPVFYQTVIANNDFYIHNVNRSVALPSDLAGYVYMIGIYDLTKYPHYKTVQHFLDGATPFDDYNLERSEDQQTARSKHNGRITSTLSHYPEIEADDRILLRDGIWVVTNVGSDNEPFELARPSDCNSLDNMKPGNICYRDGFVYEDEQGKHTYASGCFQLAPYKAKSTFAETAPSFNFIDVVEQNYSKTDGKVLLRILDKIPCSELRNIGNGQYEFDIPDFINNNSNRIVRVISESTDFGDIMDLLLQNDLDKMLEQEASQSSKKTEYICGCN